MEMALYVTSNLFHVYAVYCFADVFFEKKDFKKIYFVLAYLGFYAVNTASFLFFSSYIINIASNLVPFFLISFMYKSGIRRRLLATVLIYAVSMFIDSALYGVGTVLLKKDSIVINSGLATAILIFVTALILKSFTSRRELEYMKTGYYFALMLVPVASIVIGYQTMLEWDRKSFIVAAMLLCVNFLVFYLYDEIIRNYQNKSEMKMLQQTNVYFQHELDVLNKAELKISCLKHDMKNHFLRIEYLAKEHNDDEIIDFVKLGMAELNVNGKYVSTGNGSIDCLMNYKLDDAISKGVKAETKISLPDTLNINSFDLNTILGNLIDNAVEAIGHTDEKELYITITFSKNTLVIVIKNTYRAELFSNLDTTKKDAYNHGFGIKSVRLAVDKYNGLIDFNRDNKYFISKVLLYNE